MATFAEQEKLFRRTSRVLAAVSGGADSLALLILLQGLGPRFGFDLSVAHFDHMLRPGSRDDLERVREICDELSVPCLTGEGDVRRLAEDQKRGIEETAREMRYQFLSFMAEKEHADAIATGHTADDQVETVLMHVLRGAGVRGLRGMLPSSEVPGGAQRLVRPLLCLSHADANAACAEAELVPLEDASNADEAFTRNRIRRAILPALRELNPALEDAFLGLAASAREVFASVERESYAAQPVARLPIGSVFERETLAPLQGEALALVVEREAAFSSIDAETNRTRINNLKSVLASGTGEVRFGAVVVEASSGLVRVGPELLDPLPFEPTVLNIPGVTVAGSWRVQVATQPIAAAGGVGLAVINPSGATGALRVRHLVPGDRIVYNGIDRKVADLLVNEKVPAWERVGLIAIADSERVLAIIGSSRDFSPPASEDSLYVAVSQVP